MEQVSVWLKAWNVKKESGVLRHPAFFSSADHGLKWGKAGGLLVPEDSAQLVESGIFVVAIYDRFSYILRRIRPDNFRAFSRFLGEM